VHPREGATQKVAGGFFELKPATTARGAADLDAFHPCALPGVRCGACGRTWATNGVAYPTVDQTLLEDPEFSDRAPVSPDVFRRLEARARSALGQTRAVPPGAAFGPLSGRIVGRAAEIEWLNPWTLLFREDVLDRVPRTAGMVRMAEARLQSTRARFESLLELEIPVNGNLVIEEDADTIPCHVCGYRATSLPRSIVLRGGSVTGRPSILRPENCPTVILASSEIVDELKHARLTGVVWAPVETRFGQ